MTDYELARHLAAKGLTVSAARLNPVERLRPRPVILERSGVTQTVYLGGTVNAAGRRLRTLADDGWQFRRLGR